MGLDWNTFSLNEWAEFSFDEWSSFLVDVELLAFIAAIDSYSTLVAAGAFRTVQAVSATGAC